MKTLNENWFAFTLTAVIFGILGFLLGRTTGHHGPKGMPHMMMGEGHVMKKAMFISEDGDVDMDVMENMDIEVIKGDDGEITVNIDSVGTEGAEAKVRVIKIKKD